MRSQLERMRCVATQADMLLSPSMVEVLDRNGEASLFSLSSSILQMPGALGGLQVAAVVTGGVSQ